MWATRPDLSPITFFCQYNCLVSLFLKHFHCSLPFCNNVMGNISLVNLTDTCQTAPGARHWNSTGSRKCPVLMGHALGGRVAQKQICHKCSTKGRLLRHLIPCALFGVSYSISQRMKAQPKNHDGIQAQIWLHSNTPMRFPVSPLQ